MRRVTRRGRRSHGRFWEGEIRKDRDCICGLGTGRGQGPERVMQVTEREFWLEFIRDFEGGGSREATDSAMLAGAMERASAGRRDSACDEWDSAGVAD